MRTAILTIVSFSGRKRETKFYRLLNTLNESIKYTIEKPNKELPF